MSSQSDNVDDFGDLVYFEGPWTDEEIKVIRRAAATAEAAGMPPTTPEAGRPWVATKHVFPSFTLAMASRLKLKGTLTAPSAQALVAQIESARHRDAGEASSVFQLAYQSEAARPIDEEALRELLRQAREKNHRLGVTGVLLYKADGFLQVLEGGEQIVRALYATIRTDPRHRAVKTLLTTRTKHRVFPGWSMGLEDLDAVPADEPGITSFLESGRLPTDRDLLPEIACALEQFKER